MTTKCSKCGGDAIMKDVKAAKPGSIKGEAKASEKAVTFVIDCPKCGVRTQPAKSET